MYEFLKVLNGKLAFITTAVIFVFLVNVISCKYYSDHIVHHYSIILY